MDPNEINDLRDAIKASPENIPLRRLLAKALLKGGRYEEAELEYKNALKYAPNDTRLKIGLAQSFAEQEKTSLGLVIIEEVLDDNRNSALAYFIHAKLLQQSGESGRAKEAYERAIEMNPDLKDNFLESQINLSNMKGNKDPEPQKIKLGGYGDDHEDEKHIDVERPEVSFEDVGGMESVKEEIRMKIIHPLEHPELYKMYGKKIGGGLLMYGPPGCGKTHLARATAGQVNANFISVGISDILDMYIGQSERNLHAIFQKARDLKPCVLFFDEVDALGANRSDMRQNAGRHLINQFLAEMDGVEYDNEGVLILAATNAPWHLDPAFRRPGRFDRILFVPPPDGPARASILQIHLKEKPVGDIDYEKVAKRTKEYSGADMRALVDIAVESKLDEAIRTGKPVPITTSDIVAASKKHKPTTKEWFQTAKNYALFANDGGLYDDILGYLGIKK